MYSYSVGVNIFFRACLGYQPRLRMRDTKPRKWWMTPDSTPGPGSITTPTLGFQAQSRARSQKNRLFFWKFHFPSYVFISHTLSYFNAYCIARWGESTIFRDKAPRRMDPDVFRCAESSGSVCFYLTFHTFVARQFEKLDKNMILPLKSPYTQRG